MTRRLTREDRELWAAVRRSARPLRRRPAAAVSAEEAEAVAEPAADPPVAARSPAIAPLEKPGGDKAKVKPLADLEDRARRRLVAGRSEVDARIDLHGMTEERAHLALVGFLRASRIAGSRVVLVITGKGAEARAFETGTERPRGILRRLVPHWLARPDLRDVVLGFEPAGPRHGGAGALYVRLRRVRPGV